MSRVGLMMNRMGTAAACCECCELATSSPRSFDFYLKILAVFVPVKRVNRVSDNLTRATEAKEKAPETLPPRKPFSKCKQL
jgi:hypothetical protein